MPVELPIVCSLSAGELSQRVSAMGALGGEALVDAQLQGTHAELRFSAGTGIRDRVDAIVAAECECCPFPPEDADPVLNELVAAFRGDRPHASIA